jgi:hypothetical protein
MELDEFKILLKQQREPFAGQPIPRADVLKHLRTRSIISKLKRNLRLELLVAIAFLLFISYEAFTAETLFVKLFTALMLVFCTWFIIYVVSLYRSITFDRVSTAPVKEGLRQLIRVMEQFTRLYFLLTLIMIPVIMLLGFFSASFGQEASAGNPLSDFPTNRFIAFAALCAGWFVLMYYLTRWYLRSLYGGYLSSLRQKLHELEEED